jgi:hypothetical protein
MRQNFHQSRNGASDDPHQNLIVIHTRVLVDQEKRCQPKKASIFVAGLSFAYVGKRPKA